MASLVPIPTLMILRGCSDQSALCNGRRVRQPLLLTARPSESKRTLHGSVQSTARRASQRRSLRSTLRACLPPAAPPPLATKVLVPLAAAAHPRQTRRRALSPHFTAASRRGRGACFRDETRHRRTSLHSDRALLGRRRSRWQRGWRRRAVLQRCGSGRVATATSRSCPGAPTRCQRG